MSKNYVYESDCNFKVYNKTGRNDDQGRSNNGEDMLHIFTILVNKMRNLISEKLYHTSYYTQKRTVIYLRLLSTFNTVNLGEVYQGVEVSLRAYGNNCNGQEDCAVF